MAERFRKNLSRFSGPYFKNNDAAEAEFVELCQLRGIRTYRKSLLEYSGKGPCERPFYYLSVKNSRDHSLDSFRLTCDPGDGGMCLSQVQQIAPVIIEPRTARLLDKNDILVRNYPISPKVYLISKRLKVLLETNQASGCTFRACIAAERLNGRSLTEVGVPEEELEASANYFQLRIVSKVASPPHVGRMRKSKRCPKCNSVEIAITELQPYFLSGDLSSMDFQYCNEMFADNAGRLRLSGESAIVSGRILRLLLESGVKGFARQCTDPPVKFEVVEVRNNNSQSLRVE